MRLLFALLLSAPLAAQSVNVAAAANGATARASSTHSERYAASGAINGERAGKGWGDGPGGWNDATINETPDWLQVTFAAPSPISVVNVFTLQDDYEAGAAPTLGQTFTRDGLTDFRIETWNGSAWIVVPTGDITANRHVWRQVTFAPVTTTKIRLWITGSLNSYSRVVELEAWTAPPPRIPALVPAADDPCAASLGAGQWIDAPAVAGSDVDRRDETRFVIAGTCRAVVTLRRTSDGDRYVVAYPPCPGSTDWRIHPTLYVSRSSAITRAATVPACPSPTRIP